MILPDCAAINCKADIGRLRPGRSTSSEAVGRFAYIVSCARIQLALSRTRQLQPHGIRRPVGFRVLPSAVHMVRGRRPLRACCEVRAHLASGELSGAAPTDALGGTTDGVEKQVVHKALWLLALVC